MDPAPESLPDDVAALKAALIAERSRGLEVAAELAIARAKASEDMALIAAQKLQIAKLQRQIYGQRSERSARLIDQLALEFEELSATATEDELAAEQAAANTTPVRALILREMMLDVVKDKLKMRSDEALEARVDFERPASRILAASARRAAKRPGSPGRRTTSSPASKSCAGYTSPTAGISRRLSRRSTARPRRSTGSTPNGLRSNIRAISPGNTWQTLCPSTSPPRSGH
jgi:hypothetical protein